jgi:hypothetical protein
VPQRVIDHRRWHGLDGEPGDDAAPLRLADVEHLELEVLARGRLPPRVLGPATRRAPLGDQQLDLHGY